MGSPALFSRHQACVVCVYVCACHPLARAAAVYDLACGVVAVLVVALAPVVVVADCLRV